MYDYQAERPYLFTDAGQRLLLQIRDHIGVLVRSSGACTIGKAIGGATGDSFQALACIDRLEELGEIRILRHGLASTQACVIVPTGSRP